MIKEFILFRLCCDNCGGGCCPHGYSVVTCTGITGPTGATGATGPRGLTGATEQVT